MDLPSVLINSILILDKPAGHSSHEITTYVKKLLGVNRAGHAGTLDPNVSGVLPIALGRATKLLRYIAGKKKTYVGVIRFKRAPDPAEVRRLFSDFTGEITQTPPRESAVRKVARKRTVYRLELLELDGHSGLFETEVDAGTYIRTLCVDIGKRCGGARMQELRRTAVGGIVERMATPLPNLIDAVWQWKNQAESGALRSLLYAPDSFIDLPVVQVRDSAVLSILNGAPVLFPAILEVPKNVAKNDLVKLYTERELFIGVGRIRLSNDERSPKNHGIFIAMERMHLNLDDWRRYAKPF